MGLTLLDPSETGRLGRVLQPTVEIKARPDEDSPTVGEYSEDDVVVWWREVVGPKPDYYAQRYVETPDGYVYAPYLQPVRDQPNQPLSSLPKPEGMWVEVTVPYVDLTLANPPARSPWLGYTPRPRLYYSQIMWVDEIKMDDSGRAMYHVMERYGSYGDTFWAKAEAFRPLQEEETAPVRPESAEKLVVVNVTYQTLSCYEGDVEVYFCRVSTGPQVSQGNSSRKTWATPLGKHTIWRKLISVHMTGGTTGGGYDLPGIGWTTLFSGQGMAIHSTFWHNSFGIPKSHGCVNATPDDAKWVFRWTMPVTPFEPGDIVQQGIGSTRVLVEE
jgi:lipoprotein-anchoring transpeptidase ErfK/SrfK